MLMWIAAVFVSDLLETRICGVAAAQGAHMDVMRSCAQSRAIGRRAVGGVTWGRWLFSWSLQLQRSRTVGHAVRYLGKSAADRLPLRIRRCQSATPCSLCGSVKCTVARTTRAEFRDRQKG